MDKEEERALLVFKGKQNYESRTPSPNEPNMNDVLSFLQKMIMIIDNLIYWFDFHETWTSLEFNRDKKHMEKKKPNQQHCEQINYKKLLNGRVEAGFFFEGASC